jgi:hypothetical protein
LPDLSAREVFAERLKSAGVPSEEGEMIETFGRLLALHDKRRIA